MRLTVESFSKLFDDDLKDLVSYYFVWINLIALAVSTKVFSKGIGLHLKVLIVLELSAVIFIPNNASIPLASRSNKDKNLNKKFGAFLVLGPL